MRSRYSRWDGSQDPFGPDIPAADLLEEMSEDLLSGAGAQGALSRLMRRGMSGSFSGLDSLRARLREARDREQGRLNLQGPLQDLRERLEETLERERTALSFRAEDDARFRETFLDSLPPDTPGKIRELSDYRFVDPEAQRSFDELMEHLKQEVLGAYFRNMAQGLKDTSPEELARLRDMLSELNDMIERRERGEPFDLEGFMQRHGDFFPENPKTLDELLEQMAKRMAALERLLASMSPEQRDELKALAAQAMSDMDLAFEVDRLGSNLSSLFPESGEGAALSGGEGSMPFSAAVDAMERLHDYEDLDRSMGGDYPGASLEDVDEESLRRTLGEPAVRDLRRLKEIERALERAGLVSRRDGRLAVTPRGARKLGERALVRVFERLRRDREGTHEARETGGQAEPTGATRPWRFGDAGQIAVQRTVFNAVVRGGRGSGERLRLQPEDFELVEAEQRTEAATALLLDLSFSMPLRGHFVHAKKMALVLHALIEGRYPHDKLYMIGFSDFARRMEPQDLTSAGWERVYGTNMQHAFNLAGRLLSQHPRAARQVIMVTDGEPTAHLEGEEVFFSWPPVPKTIQLTLSEAMRLAKTGVTLNVFMLEDSPGLIRFMDRLTKLTAGRVFLMDDREIGDFIVRDYVSRRER